MRQFFFALRAWWACGIAALAFCWDRLPSGLNVSDYDVIVINLVPFEDEEFCRSINIDTLPSVEEFMTTSSVRAAKSW